MTKEHQIEENLIKQLKELKYTHRPDIVDRKTLEQNFKSKFEALNRVRLSNDEFISLREQMITPDVFAASKLLRERQYFQRQDGTPLHYTLVNIKDCQEKNITTYNLARMNMLLHGMKDTEFEIFHGDTLLNQWDILNEMNPAKKLEFDAIVANPPFSLRWEPNDTLAEDFRFKSYGLAPKSAADFAFLLHGFHFLGDDGTMAIILPHGVLFRGGAEERIRTKLLKDNNLDAVIGLPANLFYSTGIPVCILVLKKCKRQEDVLVINASEHFVKGKRQNSLNEKHIKNIVETYQYRKEIDRYSRKVLMEEIEENGYNLNISRYVSTAPEEVKVDLNEVNARLAVINDHIKKNTDKHNEFLKELGLKTI
jgi:type I restriction enzyme M protein